MGWPHRGLAAGFLTLLVLVSAAGSAVAVQPTATDQRSTVESQSPAEAQPATEALSTAQSPTASRAVADASQSGDTIVQTQRYERLRDQPGQIRVRITYDIPDRVQSLETRLLEDGRVTSFDGFNRVNSTTYEWDGTSDRATVTLRYNPNETTTKTGPEAAAGRYLFADTGEWALVKQFRTRAGWTYTQTGDGPVTLDRRLRTAGPGATGERLVYLGDVRTVERTQNGQRFRLLVPERADLAESPEAILDSVTNASASLRVGDRDESVVAIAAPTGAVDWGVRGLAYGGSEFWVRDFERLDEPDNVWLHEYVHTRQDFEPTGETRWLTEATAQYYAALLTLEQDRITFEEFRRHLAAGERSTYSDIVLADRSTWTANANYVKGALATGRIDESIRAATNRSGTFERTFRRLNDADGQVTQRVFLDAVARTGGSAPRARADEYTTTAVSLSMWDQGTHGRLFGVVPARLDYALPGGTDGYSVDGPYRNGTVSSTPVRLATGETLTVAAVVSNAGGEAGAYNATLTVDGATVDSATGQLAAESERTVRLSHTFERAGEYTLGVGEETVPVVVEPPAQPTVTGVTVDTERARKGDSAVVTATVGTDALVPANGTVGFTRDGETVARRTATVAPGASTELSATVGLPTAGEIRLGAGSATPVTVTVVEDTPGATTGGSGAGFTAGLAVLALLSTLLARRR